MFNISVDEIIRKITQKTSLSESSIRSKIKEKIDQLSNLVSEEGAAHIVANELGVKLIEGFGKEILEIKNLLPGLKNITIIGKVQMVWEVKEFKTEKAEGKVGSFLIQDHSGRTRIVLWNDHTKLITNQIIQEGDIVKVSHAYVKEGRISPEVHLSNTSRIEVNPEGIEIDVKEYSGDQTSQAVETEIKNLKEEMDRVVLRAVIVQIYEKENPFFIICPECSKRLTENNNEFECRTHGKVKPKKSMVINTIVDDGTGTIRCVFFGENAGKLLGMSVDEAYNIGEKENDYAYITRSRIPEIIGNEYKIKSDVKKNQQYERLELIARDVNPVNPVTESFKIIKEAQQS